VSADDLNSKMENLQIKFELQSSSKNTELSMLKNSREDEKKISTR